MCTWQTSVQKVNKTRLFSENNDVITERDYAEEVKAEFDMEIQSEAFGFNNNISIEDSTGEYHDKDRNDVSNEESTKMNFHSHFSDDSSYNAATLFKYKKNFIHWMYEECFVHKIWYNI